MLVSSLPDSVTRPGHHDDVCHAAAGAGGPPRPAIMVRLDRAGRAVRAATEPPLRVSGCCAGGVRPVRDSDSESAGPPSRVTVPGRRK